MKRDNSFELSLVFAIYIYVIKNKIYEISNCRAW